MRSLGLTSRLLRHRVEHADAGRLHVLEVAERVLVPAVRGLDEDVVADLQLVDVLEVAAVGRAVRGDREVADRAGHLRGRVVAECRPC